MEAFVGYIHQLITLRRQAPQNDLISSLIQAEEEGDQLTKPEPELIKSAIEEFLRYNGPVEFGINRWAGETIELAGQIIPRRAGFSCP
ncbi:hypothetical protein EV207_10716 [Scopulibacillus darangshiensis]|uniref:Uncharacterized protein n=1 Tax=Scopulibacillus darangshiensis TaxID=442528 RepID=A0A4R2P571_9BACL|nr:cytochrome P450 [Scopulibacillus darangshiensis]TCP29922.1 hypothetical protein EV207_10716 [Scopulibacillus darangshiensis]